MVVAETEEQALDAAEAVQIDYDELPFVTDRRAALEPGAPAVWDEVPGQLLHRHDVRRRRGDRPRLRGGRPRRQDGFPHRPRHGRDHGAPRRPRPLSTRIAGAMRSMPAAAAPCARSTSSPTFSACAPSQLRVQSYDVGGNFGSKNRPYVEYRPRPVGVAQDRAAGEIHGDALGDLPQRLSGPRPRHVRRAGARSRTDASSPCGRTTSAMSARAASRSRRSARAPASSPDPTTSRSRPCGRAPSSPTR